MPMFFETCCELILLARLPCATLGGESYMPVKAGTLYQEVERVTSYCSYNLRPLF